MEKKVYLVLSVISFVSFALCDTSSDEVTYQSPFTIELLQILRQISGRLSIISKNTDTECTSQINAEMNNIKQENRKLKIDLETIFNETKMEKERSKEMDEILMEKVKEMQNLTHNLQMGSITANDKFRVDQENVNKSLEILEAKAENHESFTNHSLNKLMNDIASVNATSLSTFSDIITRFEMDPSEYIGGQGGSPFSDYYAKRHGNITAFKLVCSANKVHSITLKYGDHWGVEHGNSQTGCDTWISLDHKSYQYELSSTEYITTLQGKNSDDYLDSVNGLTIRTNRRVYSACGNPSGKGKEIVAYGNRLSYISGRSGCLVDGIQPHWSFK